MAQCSQSRIIHVMKTSLIVTFSAPALCKTRLIAQSLPQIAIHALRRKVA